MKKSIEDRLKEIEWGIYAEETIIKKIGILMLNLVFASREIQLAIDTHHLLSEREKRDVRSEFDVAWDGLLSAIKEIVNTKKNLICSPQNYLRRQEDKWKPEKMKPMSFPNGMP